LEQVSDWLTKIFVGVGLVEFDQIQAKLWETSGRIASGIAGRSDLADGAQVFAASTLTYFAVCGFVFGFLWARLYLLRWFNAADDVRRLQQQVSKLEQSRHTDANALALVLQQLSAVDQGRRVDDAELQSTLQSASPQTRAEIFARTKAESEKRNQETLPGVISALRALIAIDQRGADHQSHAELSYAMRRLESPELDNALTEINEAIRVRDKRHLRGWKYYEFHRARCRILLDESFSRRQPTDPLVRDVIVADLEQAAMEARFVKWRVSMSEVGEWLTLNQIELLS